MNRVGGEGIEQEVALPRAAPAPAMPFRPPPAPDRPTDPPAARRAEPAVTRPGFIEHAKELHSVEERAVRRPPLPRETQPLREVARNPVRDFGHEPAQEPARDGDVRVRGPENTPVVETPPAVRARVQPRLEPLQEPAPRKADSPAALPSLAALSVAPAIERREQPKDAGRWPPIAQTVSWARDPGRPTAPAPSAETQFAAPGTETTAPSVHVVIGKVTVQASLPAAPAPMPARVAASGGPRLTLERYLDQRGGRA
jgi:hypothetical protein